MKHWQAYYRTVSAPFSLFYERSFDALVKMRNSNSVVIPKLCLISICLFIEY
jgi:hypothetical protein